MSFLRILMIEKWRGAVPAICRASQSKELLTGIIARLLVLLRFCFWKLPHGPPWEEITIQLWYFSAAVVVHDQIAGVPALIAERGKYAAEIHTVVADDTIVQMGKYHAIGWSYKRVWIKKSATGK